MSRRDPSMLGGKKRPPKRMVRLDQFFYDPRLFNAIVYGSPRSGKTVLLANMVNIHKGLGFNVFINDCAKGYDLKQKRPKSEILMYFSDQLEYINKKIRIFTPPGCYVDIPNYNYESVEVNSYEELFSNMKPDKLNIISFDSFVLLPLAFSRFYALFSIELLFRSKRAELYTPVLGVVDQINHIFPSQALRFSGMAGAMQDKASNYFARFLMDCSGSGIRMIASSHGITMVKKVIRMNMHYKFFKQFNEDITLAVSRIRPMQKRIESLAINEAYVSDDQAWGDLIPDIPDVPYEPVDVFYTGKFIRDPYWMLDSEFRTQVLTPAEYRKSLKSKADPEMDELKKRICAGLFYLAGVTYEELQAEFETNPMTINAWLDWCRSMYPFTILEKYRKHPRRITRKQMNTITKELQ